VNGAREMTFKIFVGGERVNSNAVLGDAWRQAVRASRSRVCARVSRERSCLKAFDGWTADDDCFVIDARTGCERQSKATI
jgi:hypothetical protein